MRKPQNVITLRAVVVAIVAAGLVVGVRTWTPSLHATTFSQCTLATLQGGYGAGTNGLINSSNDPNAITIGTFVPFAEAAIFTFDGDGHLSGGTTADFGGQIQPFTKATGSYTVDPSTCRGTMTINAANGLVFHRSLVIVNGGNEIEFVSTDAGLVIAGSLKKQAIQAIPE